MGYNAPGASTFRSKGGSLAEKITYELNQIDTEFDAGLKTAKGNLSAGTTNAFAFVWQNPESSKITISRVLIRITTAGGTATSVIDVGVTSSAPGTSDNLIDGLDLNTTGIFDNITDKGSNGKSRQVVDENGGTNSYITGKILVANAASLVGTYQIFYTIV